MAILFYFFHKIYYNTIDNKKYIFSLVSPKIIFKSNSNTFQPPRRITPNKYTRLTGLLQ